jgi:Phosphopantetheine attachment site
VLALSRNGGWAHYHGPTEKVTQIAWKQVLRKEKGAIVGPQDDFSNVGGESLSTIMLIAALRSKHPHIIAEEIIHEKELAKYGLAH